MPDIAARRAKAVTGFMRQVTTILAAEGVTPSALHALKLKLAALGQKVDLFPPAHFADPVAEGRFHPLAVPADGPALYLSINKPGKEAAPHDHGIWCVNASISGRERHLLYRRIDDATKPGVAVVEKVGEVMVAPGQGFAMADHDIHSTEVLGDAPAIGLALYGYPLARFPSVVWYHPDLGTTRATASKRHTDAA